MDPFSSGDDTAIKSRKPYTISKQRERWTEEEHNRFLEAIKLYGRAWQRIEEHIGTKTAVQIRSHAQKFFLKLEKDASGKGMLSSEVSDIDIPPPRPKKKPSNPYPRKISAPSKTGPVEGKDGKLCTTIPSCPIQQLPEFQNKGLQENPNGNEKQEKTCTAASLAPACTSMTCEMPTNLTLGNIRCTYEESASLVRKVNHENELPDEPNQHPERAGDGLATMTGEKGDLKSSQPTPDEAAEYVKKRYNFQNCYPLVSAEASQSEPCKIPAQTLDGLLEPARLSAYPIYHNHLPNQPGRATVSLHDFLSSNTSATLEPVISGSMTTPDPLTPYSLSNEDGHRSYLQFACAFSNLIISTLQQNPAALAAASVTAATFWPNMGAPAGYCPEFLPKVISSSEASPGIAAMAAATVAAATQWWASNGLISLYAPQQSVTVNQSCCTTNNAVPPYAEARTWNVTNEQTQVDPTAPLGQQVEVVDSQIFRGRNSAFKPLIRVAGKHEGNQDLLKSKQVLPTAVISNKKSTAMGAQIQGSNSPIEDRKKVDRSSSGSNTTSSTETDVLEKQDRGNEESNGPVDVQSVGDSSSRRSRITANTNESWKEVSREGRVAFRALFSWQVLPQKFPSSQDPSTLEKQGTIDKDSEVKLGALVSPIDLNSTILESRCSDQVIDDKAMVECKGKKMLNYTGLGKLRTHKTGFKPYKRSCTEAKDTNASSSCSQGKEKRPKRIGEASA